MIRKVKHSHGLTLSWLNSLYRTINHILTFNDSSSKEGLLYTGIELLVLDKDLMILELSE